jgi:hypothetical protein
MLANPILAPATITGLNTLCMVLILAFLGAVAFFIVVELCLDVWIGILKARHANIAKKWGHKVKRYRHVYEVFSPMFMVR